MNWAVQEIASHPEVQAKLQEEIDSVFGDSDRPASIQDLDRLEVSWKFHHLYKIKDSFNMGVNINWYDQSPRQYVIGPSLNKNFNLELFTSVAGRYLLIGYWSKFWSELVMVPARFPGELSLFQIQLFDQRHVNLFINYEILT